MVAGALAAQSSAGEPTFSGCPCGRPTPLANCGATCLATVLGSRPAFGAATRSTRPRGGSRTIPRGGAVGSKNRSSRIRISPLGSLVTIWRGTGMGFWGGRSERSITPGGSRGIACRAKGRASLRRIGVGSAPLASGWGIVSPVCGHQGCNACGRDIRSGGGRGFDGPGCTTSTFLRKAGYLLLSSETCWLTASSSASSAPVPGPAPRLLTFGW